MEYLIYLFNDNAIFYKQKNNKLLVYYKNRLYEVVVNTIDYSDKIKMVLSLETPDKKHYVSLLYWGCIYKTHENKKSDKTGKY